MGINAIEAIALLIIELKKIKFKDKKHFAFSKPSINIGVIKGGSAANMVPGKCELEIDIRFLPSQKPEQILKKIEKLTYNVSKKTKAKFVIEKEMSQKPFVLDHKNDFIKILEKNMKKATGIKPIKKGLEGSTFAKDLISKKIFAVGIGLGDDVAHKPNEYIQIKQLTIYGEAMILTIKEMLMD